jgi:hypothetical protein
MRNAESTPCRPAPEGAWPEISMPAAVASDTHKSGRCRPAEVRNTVDWLIREILAASIGENHSATAFTINFRRHLGLRRFQH